MRRMTLNEISTSYGHGNIKVNVIGIYEAAKTKQTTQYRPSVILQPSFVFLKTHCYCYDLQFFLNQIFSKSHLSSLIQINLNGRKHNSFLNMDGTKPAHGLERLANSI